MHARTKLALAITFASVAGTLQAAPWERADSKVQGYNVQATNPAQVQRSTRANSYSPQPAVTSAPLSRAPVTSAPVLAVQPQTAQPPAAVQAPATRQPQNVTPRMQPGTVVAPPSSLAPTNRAATQPATTYAPTQTRGYRSYSYQPQRSYGYRNNYSTPSSRVPFYMRADSKVLGREGKW